MAQDRDAGLTQAKRLAVGTGSAAREIAVLRRDGQGPGLVWLGGFRSDMRATKAETLDAWTARKGRSCLRFDYSGHGESSGRFHDGTISQWLDDTLAAIATTKGPQILVGSSMGAWLALLAARSLAASGREIAGLVLLAPAVDFTERLMWPALDADAKREIEETGIHLQPSAYSPEPVPLTKALFEDGRRHLMLDGAIRSHAPVHILQGMEDPDVPWRYAMTLVEHFAEDPVVVTIIKDGDHRLSRPQDLERLIAAVEGIAAGSAP